MGKLIQFFKSTRITIKEHLFIVGIALFISVVMLLLQHTFGDMDKGFWLSLVPNIIADMISVLFTTYLLTYLLQKNEHKKSKDRAYRLLSNRYERLIMSLASGFGQFITKKPLTYVGRRDENDRTPSRMEQHAQKLRMLALEMDTIVVQGFTSIPVRKSTPTYYIEHNATGIQEEEIDCIEYIYNMQTNSLRILNEFYSAYITVLPEDLFEKLFMIENILRSVWFSTPQLKGSPLKEVSIIEHRPEKASEEFKKLAILLAEALEYFQEYEEKR